MLCMYRFSTTRTHELNKCTVCILHNTKCKRKMRQRLQMRRDRARASMKTTKYYTKLHAMNWQKGHRVDREGETTTYAELVLLRLKCAHKKTKYTQHNTVPFANHVIETHVRLVSTFCYCYWWFLSMTILTFLCELNKHSFSLIIHSVIWFMKFFLRVLLLYLIEKKNRTFRKPLWTRNTNNDWWEIGRRKKNHWACNVYSLHSNTHLNNKIFTLSAY